MAAAACTMIFEGHPAASSASAWMPLLYESIVFGLSLYKFVPELYRRDTDTQSSHTGVIARLLIDSLLYYSVILAVTATLTIMIIKSPRNVKNIVAQTELL